MNEKPSLPVKLIFDEVLRERLQSLHSLDAQSRFEDIQPAYDETFNWLFDRQVGFEDWHRRDSAPCLCTFVYAEETGRRYCIFFDLLPPDSC